MSFVHEHDSTQKTSEVKDLLENEGKFMVKYVNGGD